MFKVHPALVRAARKVGDPVTEH